MLNWDIKSLQMQQDEIIKQARQDQLAQEMIEEARKEHPHYLPALAWVGHRMMAFGGKLVKISGDEANAQEKSTIYSPTVHLN